MYFGEKCDTMVVINLNGGKNMKTLKLLLGLTSTAVNIALTVMLIKKLKEDEDKLVEYYKK